MENPCPIDSGCFDDDVYNNSTLYVPNGTIDKYNSTDYWNKFVHIEEDAPSGINMINLSDSETLYETERFDATGKRIKEPVNGLNIVKYSNGKIKKVFVNR